MSEDSAVTDYINELKEQLASGYAGEHGYRLAFAKLMTQFEDVRATNDPRRTDYGNPDMVFYKGTNTNMILGRAETKNLQTELTKVVNTEQLRRYAGYEKLFLTNYLDFIFYQNGEEYGRISIGKVVAGRIETNNAQYSQLLDELRAFIDLPPERIRSGKKLAIIMGGKARRIRDNVAHILNEPGSNNLELEKIYNLMREMLVHDLTHEKFSDMYAQTLVYGLFVARYNDTTPDNFDRKEARDLVPKSNPFLRHFFDHIVGPDFVIRLSHIVDELCEVFSVSDVKLLIQKHLRLFEVENEKDPIIHFYEDFLKEYDPEERKRMGAYYTPLPVVRFIVHQVDVLLKSEFGLVKGLADTSKIVKEIDHGQQLQIRNAKTGRLEKTTTERREFHKVQILDPAVGTATFLNETIKFIANGFEGQEGRWPAYAQADLLPRLSGFELMMAPYTIAHLKLGMTLQETGIQELDQRLGVYLTNTLEEGIPRQQDLFTSLGLAAAVTEESQHASEIKHERPIMVIMGNPPYSVESSNKTEYANSLIDKYRIEPGGRQKLQERNSKMLGDDYVKFLAFAEDMIIRNGEGLVAMITNNGYLDNPTFRGMRWHLAKSFDKIYVLDLHGNAKKKETAPDGGSDENIFDIMQGVGIIIAIKTSDKGKGELAEVYHAELYGKRAVKFGILNNFETDWTKIELDTRYCYFIPQNTLGLDEYERGISLNELFINSSSGVSSSRDNFLVTYKRNEIVDRMQQFCDIESYDDEFIANTYSLKETSDWSVNIARNDINGFDDKKIVPINYRVFDSRWTYWDKVVNSRMREATMNHMNRAKNIGIIFKRGFDPKLSPPIFVSDEIIDRRFWSRPGMRGAESLAPLYLYHDDGSRTANFEPKVLKTFTVNLKDQYEAEDILDYIYAVLHSPNYRAKYNEFLKSDFPRVPVPENEEEFIRLVDLGRQLRGLHLMKSELFEKYVITFPEPGSDEVEKITYIDGKVWINAAQYFGGVSETAWNFYIGGYQPAQKWLKDRKGRRLSNQDIEHYQQIIKALAETKKIIQAIDK